MKKLVEKDNDLFHKYMKRVIFECESKDSKTVSSHEGQTIIKELYIGVKIEKLIEEQLNKSNCSIKKTDYSKSLIEAITRMYEVINFNFKFRKENMFSSMMNINRTYHQFLIYFNMSIKQFNKMEENS